VEAFGGGFEKQHESELKALPAYVGGALNF
jgi:hypothetical protein